MKVKMKTGGGIPFVRKIPYEFDGTKFEADIKNGDLIKILDGGNIEQSQWGEQKNFKIKTRNGEKKTPFNQATINVLIKEFGDETENWIGKEVVVLLEKKMIANKKSIIAYFVTKGWKLDEYGELVKEGSSKAQDLDEFVEDLEGLDEIDIDSI
jgi:hypothetical protein